MAYLPTVNDLSTDRSKSAESTSNIVNSLSGRMKLTSSNKSVIAPSEKNTVVESTVGSSDKTSDVLTKLYDFVVKDYSEKDILTDVDTAEREIYENNARDRILSLIRAIPNFIQKEKEDKEGILSKLWRYFKYFTFGKMVYNNWDKISKLLGLEKLTESVRSISEELGITKIIDNIKSTIDDIMQNFSLGTSNMSITGGGPIDPSKYDVMIKKIGSEEGVDPALIKSIMKAESGFNPMAKSPKGAMGLMQLMPATAGRFGVKDASDPEQNIRGGTKYLKFLSKKYQGDLTRIISAYNAGEGNVDKYGGIPPFKETKEYVKKVSGYMKETPINSQAGTNTVPESPAVPKKEDKSVFSVAPKKDVFETKSAVENVFETTTPKSKKTEPKKEITATRVSKKEDEPGEVGSNASGKTQQKEVPQGIATENDIKGLQFHGHMRKGVSNPESYEKQITKFQADKLQKLKSKLGLSSLNINSGRRSKQYNSLLEGSAENSEHINGRATDIDTSGMTDDQRVAFVRAASEVGFGGIGIYRTFIHLDTGKVRTWPGAGVKLSSDMQGVLFNHQSGRRGKDTDTSKMSPGINEPGELSSAQQSKQQSQQQSQAPSKPKSLMEMAIESYKNNVQVMNNLLSPEGIKKLEEGLINFVENIPKKEKFVPDLGAMMQQNNYVLNNVQEQKMILQNSSPLQNDLPQLLQQFLNEHQ